MFSKNKLTGDRGENIASHYLERQGYQIEERNFSTPQGEIDIIARREECLVFVEVKSRTLPSSIPGRASVTKKKKKKMGYAAEAYLVEKEWKGGFRFDIIEVYFDEKKKFSSLQHFDHAFSPRDVFPDIV